MLISDWSSDVCSSDLGAIYTRLNNDFRSETFDTDDFDDDRVSWEAFAGYRFTPIFSVEGQYIDFGDAENNSARVEADGWTAALVADIPFKFIQPYAKAGALFWYTDAHLRGPLAGASHVSNDGTDFFWGVGARMELGDNMELRLERSEEHTSELQSLMRISYDVF